MTHHLVILQSDNLRPILSGCKTVECRLSQRRSTPFGLVEPGDMLWLKESGGPIRGTAVARHVRSIHPLNPSKLNALRKRFDRLIQADASFFTQRKKAKYATFITLADVQPIKPLRVLKKDRRAWVVLTSPPVPHLRPPPPVNQTQSIGLAVCPTKRILLTPGMVMPKSAEFKR